MKKVIFGIGIPCSGKTTVLKKFAEDYNYDYICPDDLRMEMFGEIGYNISKNDSSWKDKNKKVWEELKKRFIESLDGGNTVVLDAVFNDVQRRKKFLGLAREHGAEKIEGIYIDASIEVAKERNRARERFVPEEIIEKIAAEIKEEKPKIQEGFDGIFTLDEYHNLIRVELENDGDNLKKEFRLK